MAQKKDENESDIEELRVFAAKWLRAMQAVSLVLENYGMAKSETAGLESKKKSLRAEVEKEQEKLTLTKSNVDDEIKNLGASIGQERERMEANSKDALKKISDQIEYKKGELAGMDSEVEKKKAEANKKIDELNEAVAEKSKVANAIIKDLDHKIDLKTNELNRVSRDLEKLRHSIIDARP